MIGCLSSCRFQRSTTFQSIVSLYILNLKKLKFIVSVIDVYLRSTHDDNNTISLIASKSRVAPKGVSLPRLELCGNVVAAHLIKSITANVFLKIEKNYCWSDSMIALYWITECPSKLPTFIANRVHEIKRMPHEISWRHIKGLDNPADLISRGMNSKDIINCKLWWHDPSFLQQHHSQWPQPLLEFNTSNEHHEEEIIKVKCMTTLKTAVTSNFIINMMELDGTVVKLACHQKKNCLPSSFHIELHR